MRVLLADSLSPAALARLAERGHDCVVEPDLTADELPDRIPGFDALVVRSTKVIAATIEAGDRLGVVVRAGAGTNTIDTAAAAARGVTVANVPARNSIAVAELTLGLLLAVDRRIPDAVADLRAGKWDKKTYSKAAGLHGSTMAILGFGDIGFAVAERAVAFGIDVRTRERSDRSAQTLERMERLGVGQVADLEELVADSHIVSLHLPSNADTAGIVDARFLGWMRPGSILLNTARGDLVDEEALITALDEKELRAGLDVYADEPSKGRAEWSSALAAHPRVVGTHHIGASTEQAQEAIADGVVEVLDAFAGGQTLNCVNLAPRIGSVSLTVRHLDEVGVLAHVLDQLSQVRLNVEHMENRVFRGGLAAVATIDVGGPVDDELLERLRSLENVLSVSVTSLATQRA